MAKIEKNDLENLYGTLVCTQTIKLADKVFGDKKERILSFDVYDGFAYCENYKGEEYYMIYPRKEFINISKEMSQAVKEYIGLKDDEPIKVTDILLSYNTLFKV